MEKHDVIKAAAQMEKDGRKFYLEKAEETQSTVVRKVFEQLADDELKHLEWIEENLGPPQAGREARQEAHERLSHIFAQPDRAVQDKAMAVKGDIEPLQFALDFENKSAKAYGKWAQESEDPEVRQLCKALEDVELFHVELLQNTITFLENPEQFFQQEEGWMLDGG